MVFIAMDQDVLSRTAQYQVQYVPARRRRISHGQGGDGGDGYAPEHELRQIVSFHQDDGTTSTRVRRSYVLRGDDESDARNPQMPREFAHSQPDVRVTTECSDDEDDDCDVTQVLRRAPNRIGSLPFEDGHSESDDANNPFDSEDFLDGSLRRPRQVNHHRHVHHHHHHHHHLPPAHHRRDRADRLNLSLAEAWYAHANATQEAVRAVGGELLVPHARFFIEKKKSKCTIRFEPPVSGRFILLKMWGSQHDPASNIDIQSVIARGFAGPRYFPSVELS